MKLVKHKASMHTCDRSFTLHRPQACARASLNHQHGGRGTAARTHPCTQRVQKASRLSIRAIGFNLGDEPGPSISFEKRAANSLREARRVLTFQSVLKTKPAEAFLALLRSLQGNAKDNILSDYSRFYQELSRTKCKDWKDFILEEILVARDNAWARELSRGDSKSKKLQAAANDLNILQTLALENEEIVALVRDALPEVPDVWVRAALNAGGTVDVKSRNAFPNGQANSRQNLQDESAAIEAPLSREGKAEAKASIRAMPSWSDATTVLSSVYRNHGFGLTGQSSLLQWRDGALSVFQEGDLAALLDTMNEQSVEEQDIDGWQNWPLPQQELIHDMRQLLPVLHKYGRLGLRVVFLSPAESSVEKWSTMRELTTLFRTLKPHSRMNFLVIAAIAPRNNNRSAEDLAKSMTGDLAYLTPQNTAVRFCDYTSQFNYL